LAERSLQTAVANFLSHYHGEMNHQGLGNRLIEPGEEVGRTAGEVLSREHFGGMLRYYYREAAQPDSANHASCSGAPPHEVCAGDRYRLCHQAEMRTFCGRPPLETNLRSTAVDQNSGSFPPPTIAEMHSYLTSEFIDLMRLTS